jgi:cobaltochelatase CobN
MKFSVFLALTFLLSVNTASGQQSPPANLSFIFDGGESHSPAEFMRALDGLEDSAVFKFYSTNTGGEALQDSTDLSSQDLVFIDARVDGVGINAQQLESLKNSSTRLVVINGEVAGQTVKGDVDLNAHPNIIRYWDNRSIQNDRALTLYLLNEVLGRDVSETIDEPVIYPDQSFYHPAAPSLFATLPEYQAWYEQYRTRQGLPQSADLALGLFGHLTWVLKDQTAPLDAVISEIESRGEAVYALVNRGGVNLVDFLVVEGEPVVDALLFSGEQLNYQDQQAGLAQARGLNVPLLVGITHHRVTESEYRESPGGLAPAMTPRIVFSERDGMFEPLVVATKSTQGADQPYAPWQQQVSWRVDRALSWARLKRADNADKRIVLTYWSEAGGRADVGGDPDDFLDVPGSTVALLNMLKEEGYDIGEQAIPDSDVLGRRMAEEASNIGGWATGRLAEMVSAGAVATIPEATYLQWFNTLPEQRREEIEAVWGPAPGRVMMHESADGERFLVIPRLQFGNVLLAPHPMWGYYEDDQVLMSTGELPPHHQYLAFFLWMQNEVQANAWVNMFSNLPLMPGKSQGGLADEHVGIMLGATPHIHPQRLGANGGPATRRKTLGQLLGWYNIVVPTSELGEYVELGNLVTRFTALGEPETRQQVGEVLRELLVSTGLAQSLTIDVVTATHEELVREVDTYLDELKSATAPWGSRVLGSLPADEARIAMVGGMLGNDLIDALNNAGFNAEDHRVALVSAVMLSDTATEQAVTSQLGRSIPEVAQVLDTAREYSALLDQAPRELESILETLSGSWIEPGITGEVYRNPEAMPPGRSVFTFDTALMPTVEAEAIGIRQAEALIAAHREQHNGEYPAELAFVLWSSSLSQTHGVTEAQILHLLGTRPVRNWRGQVTGVELIPREELGRPRVDVLITTSGVYRDQFQDKAELISQAVALAAASQEEDNVVMQATQAAEESLVNAGRDSALARQLSLARVFSPAPGAYSPSIQFLAKAGDQRGDEARMADLFTRRMSHAYGQGLYGESARDAFEQRLGNMSAATLPRSSDVNGMLDQPMSAGFLGGLNLAAKAVTGNDVDLYVSNLRDGNNTSIETAQSALQRELRTRYFNPAWIRENMNHGYDGARSFMFMTDHLDLWDSTATDMVTTDDWADVNDVYIEDRFDVGMDEFFDTYNPYAHQMLMINMLGASMRGHWEATQQELEVIAERLTQSVMDHGPACEANQCRNAAMTEFVATTLENLPDAAPGVEAYMAAIEAAVGGAGGAAPGAGAEVVGQRMEQVFPPQSSVQQAATVTLYFWLMLMASVLILAGWFWQARLTGREVSKV